MENEVEKRDVAELIACAGRYGVTVSEDWNEPEGARFVGSFEGTHITLFPRFDTQLALYFTVAHLYGHMVQIALKTPASSRVGQLIAPNKRPFSNEEVQIIYDHEREAAAIGRTLIAETSGISKNVDLQYHRIFLADFHYLIHFCETGEGGVDAFERFLRREPLPWDPIQPDPRPLVQLQGRMEKRDKVVVV
jgi:hypothetical protein